MSSEPCRVDRHKQSAGPQDAPGAASVAFVSGADDEPRRTQLANVAQRGAVSGEGVFDRGESADFGGETGLERSSGVGGWKRVRACEKL